MLRNRLYGWESDNTRTHTWTGIIYHNTQPALCTSSESDINLRITYGVGIQANEGNFAMILLRLEYDLRTPHKACAALHTEAPQRHLAQ